MKSIRLSLIVYFLVLSGVALGAVSWLVYANGAAMVRASAESKQRLLLKEADKRLLDRARTLARFSRWSHDHLEDFYPLGALGTVLQPGGVLNAPLWLCQGYAPQAGVARFLTPPQITIEMADDVLQNVEDGLAGEFYQLNRVNGRLIERSTSLGDQVLPLSEQARQIDDLFGAFYDDVTLQSGEHLRVVTIKIMPRPSHLPNVFPDPFYRWGPGRFGKQPPPPLSMDRPGDRRGPGRARGPGPIAYLQCATALHEAGLGGSRSDLDRRLAQVASEASETLAALRWRLFWISGLTFIALAGGGFWLVRLGLLPLARVSEAVSRVSAKDFRLPLDDRGLPSELQPIVARLKQTLDQLRRTFDREKQAAADISHELRTPLAALLTTLDVGLRKPRSAEEYRELLLECRASGRQMTHLVERLLALARLDAGVDHLRPRDVDAAIVAEECTALVRPLAQARDLTLQVHHHGPAPMRTDPDKLREILTNLLHNAIQYNRPHGSIEIAVQRKNGHVDLEVQDTGIGIAPDAKEQIFERFYRSDPSRHTDDLHAGLGLAIVKGYVDLMGGTIAVDSSLGKGTTFRVRLPAGL
jgi:heavy metal sensor kinase